MVKLFFRLATPGLALVLPLCARELSSYKLGDRAEEDIAAPFELTVIDRPATETLRLKEGERVPAVFRFYPEIAGEVTKAFHESFAATRENFLNAVLENFKVQTLAETNLGSPAFERFVSSFQKKNRLFPVSLELARIWAGGGPDDGVETPLLASLRDAMNQFIRTTNVVTGAAKVGGTVRVISYADDETVSEQMVARRGVNHPRADLISFQRAKSDLVDSMPADQRVVASYLASFIKPNCAPEQELTIVMRAKHTAGLLVRQVFSPGQFIVRQGDVIDEKTLAALQVLGEKMEARPPLETPAAVPTGRNRNLVLIGALAVAALFLGATMMTVAWRKRSASLLPEPAGQNEFNVLPVAEGDAYWQQRALAAEQKAEKAHAVIRQGLIAHLARWMSDTLVQKLLLQRAQLIEAQQKAVTEVDRLGQRLDSIHSRMHHRLVEYEGRIMELEKELDTKDEINRELIRAEIQSIRQKMEAERSRGEGSLN